MPRGRRGLPGKHAAGPRKSEGKLREPIRLRIGLTGPIGCGKSTVAGWLADLGAKVIDADDVAREVTAPGQPALEAVIDRFGERFRNADGSLDRSLLAEVVFSDPAALRDLEAITHPAVRERIREAIETAERTGGDAIVIEAIKLVGGPLAALCDEIWLVTCEPAIQRARLVGRGADAADAERRIATQGNIAERLRDAATRVIDTGGTAEATRESVSAEFHRAVDARRRAIHPGDATRHAG
ncbi:MAG TPA: dephospho-CoA kinase [Candidatus Limnocylindrales bacterium]|nr:dephospho-CoA kinase [Candidatus Limnocylindrales bacterium]